MSKDMVWKCQMAQKSNLFVEQRKRKLLIVTWGPGDSDLLCGPTAKEEGKR